MGTGTVGYLISKMYVTHGDTVGYFFFYLYFSSFTNPLQNFTSFL